MHYLSSHRMQWTLLIQVVCMIDAYHHVVKVNMTKNCGCMLRPLIMAFSLACHKSFIAQWLSNWCAEGHRFNSCRWHRFFSLSYARDMMIASFSHKYFQFVNLKKSCQKVCGGVFFKTVLWCYIIPLPNGSCFWDLVPLHTLKITSTV